MDKYYELKPGLLKQSALALGFFDGVHPGHQAVIKMAVDDARKMGIPAALVTFKEHPRSLTTGQSPPLLTQVEQRLELFSNLGIDSALVLSFTEEICRLSPREYVETVLVNTLGARSVSVGYNHHFGRNREGNPELLRELGKELGFTVNVAEPISIDGAEVSSSRIREALERGDVELVQKLLGRPFSITATVVKGDGRGRQLGFPTANLRIPETQILPARGVYAGVVGIADGQKLPAVINIGYRPTVTAGVNLIVEAHVLEFEADLYGQMVAVDFRTYIRTEKKFDSVDDLKNQIGFDCLTASQFFASEEGLEEVPGTMQA